mgnify:CR=1 FL=1
MHNRDQEKLESSKTEFDLISNLKRHKNIIEGIEFISTRDLLYIILELAPGLEL